MSGVALKLCERSLSDDRRPVGLLLRPQDTSPLGVQVTEHVPHAALRDGDAHGHDGFEKHGRRVPHRLLKRLPARYLEGNIFGIHGSLLAAVHALLTTTTT